jgi:hypothetical protein
VVVKENLYRWSNWKILTQTHKYEKEDARTISFPVKSRKMVKRWFDIECATPGDASRGRLRGGIFRPTGYAERRNALRPRQSV